MSLAQTGKTSLALTTARTTAFNSASNSARNPTITNALTSARNSTPWILDSGASDHMTNRSKVFQTYKPTSGFNTVKTADGSLSKIVGTGSINLSDTLNLKNVLHVPRLSCSLLSIHKLCRDSNCHADFYAPHCIIQELGTERKIGSAKQTGGLYLLDVPESQGREVQGLSSVALPAIDPIMLWHLRLRHPNFLYLKRIFPQLFSKTLPTCFDCEHCILSKSHRTVYSPRPYQASKPFYTIHSDVWGPSRTATLSNKK